MRRRHPVWDNKMIWYTEMKCAKLLCRRDWMETPAACCNCAVFLGESAIAKQDSSRISSHLPVEERCHEMCVCVCVCVCVCLSLQLIASPC